MHAVIMSRFMGWMIEKVMGMAMGMVMDDGYDVEYDGYDGYDG